MTRVIIEGLHHRASLLGALQVVLEVLNRDGAFAPWREPSPTSYVPCPRESR
ncbi:MAG: hypothetical protein ACRDPJ_14385 [Nocardioidaceae bacterium]